MSTKLLFLPHCLKPEYLQKLKDEGVKREYQVFVVAGGAAVKKILTQHKKINQIVGVACADEIKLAKNYTKKLKNKGTEVKAVQLSTDGCKNTEVNIEKVVEALKED